MLEGSVVCHLEIWDTSGQEDLNNNRLMWMSEKDAIIFVYSID